MNKGMWKRNLRRGAALALTLVMSLSIAACGAAQERLAAQAAGNAGVAGVMAHEAVPYSRRPYEHYDPAVMEQAMADFEQACAVEGRDEEVLRLYDAIVDEYDRLATLTYMAQLEYDADVSDEQAASEQAYTTDIYSEMGDKAAACLKKGMNSSYKKVLADKMGIENAPYIEYYRENTGELTELNRKEQELLREYDKLAAGDFTVELENGQWSYSRLEREPDLDDGQYAEIEDALVREKNRVLGSKFRELVQVRRRIAELKGYDNYAQYSFEAVYGRDYTLQDAEELCADVKTSIVPLNNDIWHMDVAQESYDSLDLMEESSTEDILACVGRTVQSVNPELGEIFRYMQDNELYDIRSGEDGQDRMDNNYTVGFPSYGDAFIFINRNNTFTDYQSLIHEFGHFSSYYYNSVPELFQGYSVDVCEVQSQGLEMLANQYAVDMFGEGAEAFEFEDYQAGRILAWFYPDQYGEARYQQNNSIIAIGSGQLKGKGLFNTTIASVKNGNFLSEEQTDFIFAVIGEELGFIGCVVVIALFLLIIYECLMMAARARDLSGRLICVGMATLIAFQAFANIAVATGIFPNTGLPLPFISFGSSSLISIFMGIGLVLNVGLQRETRHI